MLPKVVGQAPSLSTFLKSLKQNDIDSSIELFVALLKRRQIKNARPCSIATVQLLLRVVAVERTHDINQFIKRVRQVGNILIAAQPREMGVGNIVRRVLGIIREVAEQDQASRAASEAASLAASPSGAIAPRPNLSSNISDLSPLNHGAALPQTLQQPLIIEPETPEIAPQRPSLQSTAMPTQSMTSLFSILQRPDRDSPTGTPPRPLMPRPGQGVKTALIPQEKLDIKAEIIDGIKELIDELDVVDSQIAESALNHVLDGEIIMTHTSSVTVQRFLLAAARKRKFTVYHAEAYPNNHFETHSTIAWGARKEGEDEDSDNPRWKALQDMGIEVQCIPDQLISVFMGHVDKVFLAPHAVLANGSLIAAAGANSIAQAAKDHRVPVTVLSGIYKLSPVYPFDTEELIEIGDPGKVVPFQEGKFIDETDVINPLYNFVDSQLLNLYITNLGGHAPSYLYRIVADHYRPEDLDLTGRVMKRVA